MNVLFEFDLILYENLTFPISLHINYLVTRMTTVEKFVNLSS